jgi:hypothetical protein
MYYGLFSIKYKCKFNSDRENKLRVSIGDKGILEFKYLMIAAHFSRTDYLEGEGEGVRVWVRV